MRVAILLVLLSLCLTALAQDLPEPIMEFRFNGDVRNAGTLGGEGEMVEYLPDEGPEYCLGVAGLGMSFERSSRSGGTTTDPAGGAVLFSDEYLANLRQYTLATWFRFIETTGPTRLLYTTQWDLFAGNGRMAFKIKAGGEDRFLSMPSDAPSASESSWNFVAVTVDFDAGSAVMYLADGEQPPIAIARWDDLAEPDPGSPQVQIGNLNGIRPLRGEMDNVRIFDVALSERQVLDLHAGDSSDVRTLKDYLAPTEDNQLGIKHSDVFFSTRWARDEAPEAVKAFGANRVVWVYTSSAEFVQKIHAMGATIQGAVNSVPRTKDLSAYTVDLDGTRLVAPWMVTFNKKDPVKWGCSNQPAYRKALMEQARAALDAGVDWLQFDDGALNVSAHSWGGGCMCDECMKAFREYLSTLPEERLREAGIDSLEGFDYREFMANKHGIADAKTYKERRRTLPTTPLFEDFLRVNVRDFFDWFRDEIDEHAGRRVPLSINSNLQDASQRNRFMTDKVDFLLGETWSETLADLTVCARAAEAHGTLQITSPFPHNVPDTRIALAATYALGQYYLVPWDVWMGPEKPRHFGTVEEYGDLYTFIRDNADLLDNFETPAIAGVIIDADRFSKQRTQAIARRLLRARVPFSFVVAGHQYYDKFLDSARLAQFSLLISVCDLDGLHPGDLETIESVRGQVPILSDRQVGERTLAPFAPIEVWGPDEVVVMPRVLNDPQRKVLACHVLNRNQAEAGADVLPLRYVSIGLKGPALLGSKVLSATWHAPGKEPEELMMDELPGAVRLIIPQLDEWGIARVEFAD